LLIQFTEEKFEESEEDCIESPLRYLQEKPSNHKEKLSEEYSPQIVPKLIDFDSDNSIHEEEATKQSESPF
jgi:hypothetical protein